jgi:chromosomal replication initiation ATPase DnaA
MKEVNEMTINELLDTIRILRIELNGMTKSNHFAKHINLKNLHNAMPLIFEFMSSEFGFSEMELKGLRRFGHLTRIRHLLIRSIYLNGNVSIQKIGFIFNSRDHSTIINSITKAHNLVTIEEEFAEYYDKIDEAVKGFLKY